MKTNRRVNPHVLFGDRLLSAVIAMLFVLSFTPSAAFDANNALAQSKPTQKSGTQVKRRPGGLRLRRYQFDTVKLKRGPVDLLPFDEIVQGGEAR